MVADNKIRELIRITTDNSIIHIENKFLKQYLMCMINFEIYKNKKYFQLLIKDVTNNI